MIRINGIGWKVLIVSSNHPALETEDGYTLGVCDNDVKTIYISEDLSSEKLKKVLCHEVTHAAMFSYGVYLDIEQEELLADLLATFGREIIYTANKIFRKLIV